MMRLRSLAAWTAAAPRRQASRHVVGCTRRPPAESTDLAESPELEVLGDVQRLRQAHQHALEAFGVVDAGNRRGNGSVTGVGVDRRVVPQLRIAVTLPICV